MQLRQNCIDVVNRINNIGAGLTEYDDQDGGLAYALRAGPLRTTFSGEPGGMDVFHRVHNIPNIAQADRRAILLVVTDD